MQIVMLLVLILCAGLARGADYVIAVSVDGLGAGYMQTQIDAGRLPHFKRMQTEGVFTLNARTDYDMTVTLPNHICMLTSRPVRGDAGHGWALNTDPAKGQTLQSNRGAYVASVFDVAHDNGCRTGLWSTKTKFALFQVSYDGTNGAPDVTGADNGRNKLDLSTYKKTASELCADFVASMTAQPCQFAFIHFGDTDAVGHRSGWGSEDYNATLSTVDDCLGQIMNLMTTHPALRGKTTLLVTTDHGGFQNSHSAPELPLNYTIPFMAWGTGVSAGDLYAVNRTTRQSPDDGRPDYTAVPQPIRNGAIGNLALSLLHLGPIPGSLIDARQDLRLSDDPK